MINKFENGLLQECLAIIDGEVNFGDGESLSLLPANMYNDKEVYTTNACGSKNYQQVSLRTGLLKATHQLYLGSGSS